MDRKEQILEVATELVQTRGYTAFSYQDLSDRLGITEASIHHHYPSKESLGVAVSDRYAADVKAILVKAKGKTDDPLAQLDGYMKLVLDIIKTQDRICAAGSVQSEINVVPESIGRSMCSIVQYVIDWISDVIQDGREQGVMAFPGSSETQAAMIFATAQGAMQYGRAQGQKKARLVIHQIKEMLRP